MKGPRFPGIFSGSKAIISSIVHLWFTFFHEAAHVLRHGKKTVFIDDDIESDDEQEQEADMLARNALIPPDRAVELKRLKGRVAICNFARSIGVAPGIVVGRMQRDKILSPRFCHDLKVRIQWPLERTGDA
ncbi:MAG: ImmA/IrrE family metallo-endopeptidase [Planctomycetes bacterium]|nr:ImmA/IrrE family metallo-endopeptidase [Planctomycetota bacterium]